MTKTPTTSAVIAAPAAMNGRIRKTTGLMLFIGYLAWPV
jgi:hypothetical protein